MFSETLHKAIQGCGSHPAVRMTPVRLLKKLLKHKPIVFPVSPFHSSFFDSLTLDWKLEGGRTLQSKKQQRAIHAL